MRSACRRSLLRLGPQRRDPKNRNQALFFARNTKRTTRAHNSQLSPRLSRYKPFQVSNAGLVLRYRACVRHCQERAQLLSPAWPLVCLCNHTQHAPAPCPARCLASPHTRTRVTAKLGPGRHSGTQIQVNCLNYGSSMSVFLSSHIIPCYGEIKRTRTH